MCMCVCFLKYGKAGGGNHGIDYDFSLGKDVAKLMEYAKERKVLKKVQSMIGVWL